MLQDLDKKTNLIQSLKFWEIERKNLEAIARSIPSTENLSNADFANSEFSRYWKAIGIENYIQWSVIKKVW